MPLYAVVQAAEDAARAAAEAAGRRSAAEAGEKLDEAGALAVLEEVQAEGGVAALQKLLPKMSVEGGLAVKVRQGGMGFAGGMVEVSRERSGFKEVLKL